LSYKSILRKLEVGEGFEPPLRIGYRQTTAFEAGAIPGSANLPYKIQFRYNATFTGEMNFIVETYTVQFIVWLPRVDSNHHYLSQSQGSCH
jgi:hypothetical protein